MHDDRAVWGELISRFPGDFTFRGTLLRVLPLALAEFTTMAAGKWTLDDVEILGSVSADGELGTLSFIPGAASRCEDGMLAGGVTYVYSLGNMALVSTRCLP